MAASNVMCRLHERLGTTYVGIVLGLQAVASLVLADLVLLAIASFYDPTKEEILHLGLIVTGFVMLGLLVAAKRGRDLLRPALDWARQDDPDEEGAEEAWRAAVTFPAKSFGRNLVLVNTIIGLPAAIATVLLLDLAWTSFFVVLAALLVPLAYGTLLNFAITEAVLAPVVERIAACLPPGFRFEGHGFSIGRRVRATLLIFTAGTGLGVAAIVNDDTGTGALLFALAAAVLVALMVSGEAIMLVSRTIVTPLDRLAEALRRVGEGDFDTRVPVTSGDELGEMANAFNEMAAGLAEREILQERFGTYHDPAVARLLLRGGSVVANGREVDATILMCDVRGFTRFAETRPPMVVVEALNALFDAVVPVLTKHGGHVDKFVGDGVLTVFGPPEGYEDHADRAVAAACELVDAVARADLPLRVGVGLCSGRVLAGSIGGGGRLNFTVIGDAVNVAARVEAATRDTGDAVLLAASTRDALHRPRKLVERGVVALRGRNAPVELFAPAGLAGRSEVFELPGAEAPLAAGEEPAAATG